MTSIPSPPPPRPAPSDPLRGTPSHRRPERSEGPVELQKDHHQSGLAMIAAADRRGAIGRANQMPWHLPDDLQRFKALTLGHHVIMGRKTFESIGRPLPGRTNVIITRQPDFAIPGAQVAHSLEDALSLCAADAEPFIIGGGEVYRQALPLAQTLYLTEVDTVVSDADATFPNLNPDDWRLVAAEPHPSDARHAYPFRWATYRRIGR